MLDLEKLPTISAERVCLRWLEQRDVNALFAIFSDPEVMRYWSSPCLTSREEAARLLDDIHECFKSRTLFQWGVARKPDDLIIGTCTLAQVDATNRRAELGFALGSSHWRKGYMNEALRALLRFAFGELNLRRLEADVDPRNTASIRTVERLGFQREGYLRERWLVNGEVQDAVLFGLLQRDWELTDPTLPRAGVGCSP